MSDLDQLFRLTERAANTERDVNDLKRNLDDLNKGVIAFAQKVDEDKKNADAALVSITKQQDADRNTIAEQQQAIQGLQALLAEMAEHLAVPADQSRNGVQRVKTRA